jgi:hypothetical protein
LRLCVFALGNIRRDASAVLIFPLGHATVVHFKKTGNLTDRAKVDMSKSEIVKLRTQELVNKTTAIRDLATVVGADPNAAKRGVTAARCCGRSRWTERPSSSR